MRGLLCELVPVSSRSAEQVARWLAATDCEALLRGTSSDLAREALYASMESTDSRVAVVRDLRGTEVGIVHWWQISEGVYEMGGAVGEERLWRTGMGMEAGNLVVDYLFEVLACRRVEFTTGAHNAAVLSVGLDDGMTFEAVCQDYFAAPDGTVPAVKSGLVRDEYYGPYPYYQPRVGRRLDQAALSRCEQSVRRWVDVAVIADSLTEDHLMSEDAR